MTVESAEVMVCDVGECDSPSSAAPGADVSSADSWDGESFGVGSVGEPLEFDDVGVLFSSGAEPFGLEEGPASDDAADGESSAHATPGVGTSAPPMPSATARAPIRPTYRAYRLVVQSMYAMPCELVGE